GAELRRLRPGDPEGDAAASCGPARDARAHPVAPGRGRPAPAAPAGLGISDDGHHLSGRGRAHAARGPVRELRTERPARPHVRRRSTPRHEFPARDRGYAHEFRRLGRPEISVWVGGATTMTTPLPEGRLTRDHLERLLGKMADRRVVVVGDAMLDIYLSGD